MAARSIVVHEGRTPCEDPKGREVRETATALVVAIPCHPMSCLKSSHVLVWPIVVLRLRDSEGDGLGLNESKRSSPAVW